MEQWKPVKGFEAYEVSDLGRVRRIKAAKGAKVGQVLKPYPQNKGYLLVKLQKKTVALHKLVAKTFIPNPLGLPEVNHKGPKSDCRASMLEWRSGKGNMLHAVQNGLRRGNEAGVRFNERLQKWTAKYSPEPNKEVWLGTFLTKEEALEARKTAVDSLPYVL
jgi:hypothetical protein